MKRSLWLGLIVLVLVAAAGLVLVERRASPPPTAPPQAAASPDAATPGSPAPAPSFDAVHVGPDGSAVLAGRAAPGAEVTVLDHGAAIGHVTADANGEWVLTPDRKLPPGPQELSLSARAPGASEPQSSTAAVAVLVPERQPGAAPSPPVAVLLPQESGGAARPIQMPGGRTAHHVVLDIVEYDASGRTILSGRADAGARIDVFVDGRRLATVTADAAGNWSAELAGGVPEGRYRLRLVGHDASGGEVGELALELRRAAPSELAGGGAVAIMPGNTLWHLAQRSYGDGVRYVEIYRANRDKVDDPNLIYPGQLLALPAKP